MQLKVHGIIGVPGVLAQVMELKAEQGHIQMAINLALAIILKQVPILAFRPRTTTATMDHVPIPFVRVSALQAQTSSRTMYQRIAPGIIG